MPTPLRSRWILSVLAGAVVFGLYFFGLARAGMLGPDEPRYAAIGKQMAQSGDWITPRLWGSPWFEKPALLYWMTASGYKLGLPDDYAPRIPVAALSVGFLVFFWFSLRRDYDARIASYATIMLGTSIGWLAYSHVAVTDIPLAVCFSSSMLLVIAGRQPVVAGVLFGLALLAKGLLPFILFVPALWFFRERWKQLATVVGVGLVVAAPWYVLVTLRNGMPFIQDLFLKQHFARFFTNELKHVQRWWYYIPVLLAGIFPWTPVIATTFRRSLYADRREKFLLAWLMFGFVFFSSSLNKLPGYLLPLLPPLVILMAVGLARGQALGWVLALSGALIWLIPAIAAILPQALLRGITHAPLHFNYAFLAPMMLVAAALWWLDAHGQRDRAVVAIGFLLSASLIRVVWDTYPILDRTYSARPVWRRAVETHLEHNLCVETTIRSRQYGLFYYAGKIVPDCIP